MNIKEIFEDFKAENYLEPYQLSLIKEMRQNGLDDDAIIQSFLEVPNKESIQSFGGTNTTKSIVLNIVKKEFFDLLCGDKYTKERETLFESKTTHSVISGVSGYGHL